MLSTIRHAWNRLRTIARPFAEYDGRWRAVALFGVLVTLVLTVAWLNVRNSYVGEKFMTSLERRESGSFVTWANWYIGVFLLITFVQVMQSWCEQRLDVMLREGLTRHLVGRYLTNRTYYRLQYNADIDNPDQRISQDVQTFTAMSVSFALTLLMAFLNLIGFIRVLWDITPLLVGAAAAYATFGSLMTILIGRKLVRLNFLQLKKEADFRFGLIRTRENSEAIAMQGGEEGEERRLLFRLGELIDNFKRVIGVNRNIQFFTVGYNYLTAVIPVLITAPLFFNDQLRFGQVSQSIGAFTFVLGALSVIISQFQQISQFAAGAERVGALIDAVDAVPAVAAANAPHVNVGEDEAKVAFDHLSLRTPDDRELINDLSFTLPPGQRLLISGQNGAGKTALFQAIDGMWDFGSGRIFRPPHGEVMFLPQKPYLAPGKLREQLLDGVGSKPRTDDEIKSVLRELRIEKVLVRAGGLDADKDWGTTLSPGELRLLSFARLVLAQPAYAFLDVGISGLDDYWVNTLYRALSRTRTVYVSIGENETLRVYHDVELILAGHGHWAVQECRKAAAG